MAITKAIDHMIFDLQETVMEQDFEIVQVKMEMHLLR
jgi:hypothetical protein